MSHLYKPAEDTYTSKGRQKVSTYQTTFFNTFQYGKETDVWDERVTNGGTATHDVTESMVIMEVNNQTGSEVIRQTKNVMRYIPGRASTLSFGIRLENPVTGIRRRFGLFDGDDGAFFEDAGDGNYYCVVRNNNGATGPELYRVAREDWNGDKLDGTGVSGIVASASAQQLINIEYEWYGSGQVIFSYIINGKTHTIHTFNFGNILDSVWCSTPFLPIRVEITNLTGVAGTHRLYQGSNSLLQEGEPEKLGISENITNSGIATNITYTNLPSANQYYPIISIKLKPTQLKAIVLPTYFQVATTDNTNIAYKFVQNATLVGAAFTNHPDPNSFSQFDISATSFSNGDVLDTGFAFGQGGIVIELDKQTQYQIGRTGIGTISDTLTLCVAATGSNKNAVASITWIEQR
jgi:hypothetical protein